MKNSGCYWCGVKATTSDHVPPLNLFPKKQRDKNLATVPACFEHNNRFSKLEERMRFYLQAACNTPSAFEQFDTVTMPSLENPKAAGLAKRLLRDIRPPTASSPPLVPINPSDHLLYFEKITRGIYYLVRKRHSTGDFVGGFRQSFAATKSMLEFFSKLSPHFNGPNAREGKVTHPEIFRYRYILIESDGLELFCVAMQFYQSMEAIGILKSAGE